MPTSYLSLHTFELDEWTVRFDALPPVRQDYYTRSAPLGWHPVRWFELHTKWDDAPEKTRRRDMRVLREVAAKWFFGTGHRRTSRRELSP